MSEVILQDVVFRYGEVAAADHVSLHIRQGEFFALLGPSGSGKTTLLRMIAGFIKPQHGKVVIAGDEVQNVPVYRRNIGFVFQNYALFPHMTVAQNVAFGLESRRAPRKIIRERVAETLALVQLVGYEDRHPAQLSGGQQQRVALARALVTEPHVLLLDEPLAALDRKLRGEMQVELSQIQKRLGITTVFVTHDQEEAMTLADRIAVLKDGKVEQVGTAQAVYERPRTPFTANFLGLSNIFTGEVTGTADGCLILNTATGEEIAAQTTRDYPQGATVSVVVRPERIRLETKPDTADGGNVVQAIVTHITYTGSSLTYHLEDAHHMPLVVFEQSGLRDRAPAPGEEVYMVWSPEHTLVLEEAQAHG